MGAPTPKDEEHSTFLIEPDGKINRVFAKVKADGHAEEVLAAVE